MEGNRSLLGDGTSMRRGLPQTRTFPIPLGASTPFSTMNVSGNRHFGQAAGKGTLTGLLSLCTHTHLLAAGEEGGEVEGGKEGRRQA